MDTELEKAIEFVAPFVEEARFELLVFFFAAIGFAVIAIILGALLYKYKGDMVFVNFLLKQLFSILYFSISNFQFLI